MWMRVDDGLPTHRKTRAVLKSHDRKTRDAAPLGIWALAGAWAGRHRTEGWVPEDELDRWDDNWQPLVDRLVKAGFWWPHDRDGEPGYGFNDWHDYNDPADAASKAGTFGNHVRWHVNEGKVEPECEHCPKEPETPEDRGDIGGRSGGDIAPDSGGESQPPSGAIALPLPEPETRPEPEPNSISSDADAPTPSIALVERPEIDRLCDHLADRIAEDGSKRPTIGKGWHDAARLMLDRDGRTEQEIHAAIDWCQSHHFWRTNVLSMPKLREKFDQLRKVATAEQASKPRRQQETDDLFDRAAVRMGVTGDLR